MRCNAIPEPVPASNDPIQSTPFGGGSSGGVVSQFGPSQNSPTAFGSQNARPSYFGSQSPLMPFPTYINQQPPPQQPQQFGGQLPSYPYVSLYSGNNVGSSPQMLPYYGQFRPYGNGQAAGGIGASFGSASLMPFGSRFQTNLQFGQQPTLFDRMDTAKQADEQEKKPTQQ